MFHLLLPSLTPLLRGHPADPLSYCITRLFLMIRPPQRSTLFPYTTLFRSLRVSGIVMRLRMFLLLITFLKASHSFRNRLQEGDKDRKSGSAGMPRPISYAVFCLQRKVRSSVKPCVQLMLVHSVTCARL